MKKCLLVLVCLFLVFRVPAFAYDLDDPLPAARSGEYAFRTWLDDMRSDTLARLLLKADADHTHGEGGVVVSIVADAASLGTGNTDGEMKIAADTGNRWTWYAAGGKWRIAAGNVYAGGDPSCTTYACETGVIIDSAGVSKYWDGDSWEALVDTSLSVLPADVEVLQNNLGLEIFRRMVGDSAAIENFQDGWSDVFTDQTGVDDDNCIHAVYDSDSNFYSNDYGINQESSNSSGARVGNYSGNEYRQAQSFQLPIDATIESISIYVASVNGFTFRWYNGKD